MPYEENPFQVAWTPPPLDEPGMEEWQHPDLAPQHYTQEEGKGRLPTAQERAEAFRDDRHAKFLEEFPARMERYRNAPWHAHAIEAARLAAMALRTEGGIPGVRAGGYMPEPFQLPGVRQVDNPLNLSGNKPLMLQETAPVAGAWMSKEGKQELPPEQPTHYFQPHAPMSGPDGWEAAGKATPGYRQAHDVAGMPTIPTLRHIADNLKGTLAQPAGTAISWAEDPTTMVAALDALLALASKGRIKGLGGRGLGMGASTVESLPRRPPQ